MQGPLITEPELLAKLPVSSRKLTRLRLEERVPYLKIDRYTRLYCLEQVISSLEIKVKKESP
jgi:hypothetical protein